MSGLAPLGPSHVDGFLGDQVKKRLAPQKVLLAGAAVFVVGMILESRLARIAAAGGAGLAVLSFFAIEEDKKKKKK